MTYAVQTDMSNEFGDVELAQLCDRTSGANMDAAAIAVLNGALSRVDEEINSYVAQRYTLPFTSVPARLRSIALDMARYYLYDYRAPQIVQDRYNRAVAWLKDVAANKATIGDDAAGNVISVASDLGMSVQTSDQVFTDDLFCRYSGGDAPCVP